MGDAAISRIALDAAGRLRVYPRLVQGKNYSHIYRSASSVRFDENDASLYVLPVDGFTAVDELNQILKAVKGEYGDCLFIDNSTGFDVPPEVEASLRG